MFVFLLSISAFVISFAWANREVDMSAKAAELENTLNGWRDKVAPKPQTFSKINESYIENNTNIVLVKDNIAGCEYLVMRGAAGYAGWGGMTVRLDKEGKPICSK